MYGNLAPRRPLRRVFRVLRSPEDAVFRADEVEDELDVAAPISRIVEDENGGEGDGGEVGMLSEAATGSVSSASWTSEAAFAP